MRRFIVVAAITTALTLGVGGGWAGAGGVALAAPDERGNCLAVLTSTYGPEGTVDNAVHDLQAIAAANRIPPGELAAKLAQVHGTVDECFAVLEELITQP